MDTSEATQLLTWLDEERRRDKALLAELQKSTEQHEHHLSNVAERMESLEERQAQTNAELARMSRFEEALQKSEAEYKTNLATLDAGYLAALERLKGTLGREENLEQAGFVLKEIDSVKARTPLPALSPKADCGRQIILPPLRLPTQSQRREAGATTNASMPGPFGAGRWDHWPSRSFRAECRNASSSGRSARWGGSPACRTARPSAALLCLPG